MNYLWVNSFCRVIPDDGALTELGEVLSDDQVIVGDEGSLFRKSDLSGGRLARVRGTDLGIVVKDQGLRNNGPVPMCFVIFGKLNRPDSWVPFQVVELL